MPGSSATTLGSHGFKLRWAFWLLVAGGLVSADVRGQPAQSASANEPVITSIRQFWNLTSEERQRSHPFRIECDVSFYDPIWKNLWIQDSFEGAYVRVGTANLPLKSGQHVVVTGTFEPPLRDLSFEHATVVSSPSHEIVPVLAAGRLDRIDLLGNLIVSLEAFVVRQNRLDADHLHLTLTAEGTTFYAYVSVDSSTVVPDYVDSTVKIRGVYVGSTSGEAKKLLLEMRVASPDHIKVLSWLGDDQRFKLPVSPIASLAPLPRAQLVRIMGEVKAQEPGRYLRIRDETGQIDVITGQMRNAMIDERVEAIGYPLIDGTNWKLVDGLYRSVTSPLPISQGTPATALRVTAQVLELSPEEAAAGRPVLISGVVTWSHPDVPYLFVQDASGGVCVARGTLTERFRTGRNIEVKGNTSMGPFAPMIIATEMKRIGNVAMPAARQVSLESALTGVEEAQWVEMRGYLRKVELDGAWTHLELTTSVGNFRAELPSTDDLIALEGSVIRLNGVCTADADERRKLNGIKLLVPSSEYVQIEETAPKELFDQPARLLANLGQYGTLKAFNRRVKISGTVLNHSVSHFINLIEGDETLMVLTRQDTPLSAGDRIDAVGFLGQQAGRPVLREAVYRQTGHGDAPAPQLLAKPGLIRTELDGSLVKTTATLIDDSTVGDQMRLTMQSENAIFEAYLDQAAAPDRKSPLPVGSVVRLTGVYQIKFTDDGHPSAFFILLRSSSDIAVLERPSSLTRERILTFAATLGVGIVLFIAWVVALRRRVKKQTDQIRGQLEKEARLESELQRATKLESLGILAGGIAHDFNNLLTVVMGNLSLAMLDLKKEAESTSWLREAERAVGRARDLTQQLLTFSKGGAPIRSAVVLADIVQEVAQFALRGSNVRCVFEIAPNLWPADVDKGQIGQVVQNIVINAMQVMPDGGQIKIALHNETDDPGIGKILAPGQFLKLTIRDQGSGIAPENIGRIFEPYFTTKTSGNGLGLATVYSIVKKHLGHITVESVLGEGTTFHIWLPAAVAAALANQASEPAPVGLGRGRILFMDDDPEIRRLGLAMLTRLGYQAKSVSDGVEAITEYRKTFGTAAAFDLVVLDLTVQGGMGGCDAVEKLHAFDPNVRAVVSSGYSNDEVLSNYRHHGFCGIVSKPYETAALAAVLNQALQRSTV
ncbi:MAG: ATP-binding protein [Opitutus sp.]